jgi:hypothetical protein
MVASRNGELELGGLQSKKGAKMHIRVEHCIGHHGLQMPARLLFDDRHVDVVEILDQWHGWECRYVKVRCDNGCLYILRHDPSRKDWELTMFKSVRTPEFLGQLHDMKAAH